MGHPFLRGLNTRFVYFQHLKSSLIRTHTSRRRESTIFMIGVNVLYTETVFMWVSHDMPNHSYTYLHVCTYIIIVSIACTYNISAFITQRVYSSCCIIYIYSGWTDVWGCVLAWYGHTHAVYWVLLCRWMIIRQAGPKDTSLDTRWNAII